MSNVTKEECQHCQDKIREELSDLRDEHKTFVTWTIFWSIFGLLVTVLIVSGGYLFSKTNDSQIVNAKVEVQLVQINQNLLDLKLSLEKHQNIMDDLDKKSSK